MSKKIDVNAIATDVAKSLLTNPKLLDKFMGAPHESVTEISGVSGLSAIDMGSILSTMLAGSNEGKGMLGDLAGTLLGTKKTNSGAPNLVGTLISQVVGKKDSNDLITMLVSVSLSNVLSGNKQPETKKKTTTTKVEPKKTTTKNDEAKKTTAKKAEPKATTTKKAEPKSTTTTKAPAKTTTTKKTTKQAEPDLLSTLVDVLGNSDIDISDLLGNLLGGNKKR